MNFNLSLKDTLAIALYILIMIGLVLVAAPPNHWVSDEIKGIATTELSQPHSLNERPEQEARTALN